MNKKRVKLALNLIMSLLIVLLMSIKPFGVRVHEVLGYTLAVLFAVHIALNFKWLRAVVPMLFTPKINRRARLMFVLDALIALTVAVLILSGHIAANVMRHTRFDVVLWSKIHVFCGYLALILIFCHAGLHINLRAVFKKISKPLKITIAVIYLSLAVLSVTSFVFTQKRTVFTAPFTHRRGQSGEIKYYYPEAVYQADGNTLTLNEFLSRLRCGGCSRACPLVALRCDKGILYKNSATEQHTAGGIPANGEPFTVPYPIDVLALVVFCTATAAATSIKKS